MIRIAINGFGRIGRTVRSFKDSGDAKMDSLLGRAMNGNWNSGDYTDFIRHFVSKHYGETIRLAQLAMVLHLSPSYLSTRFKADTGVSFTEYLVRFRMEKAKELLRNTNDSCRQIAENVGYSDYVQFSKMFKKYTAQNPVEYRRDN